MDRAEDLVATARLGVSARREVVAGALPRDLRRALVRRGSRAAESRTTQYYIRTYTHASRLSLLVLGLARLLHVRRTCGTTSGAHIRTYHVMWGLLVAREFEAMSVFALSS